MAGFTKINKRGRDGWSIRFYVKGIRKNISLPPIDESDVMLWCKHIDHLKWTIETGSSRDPATLTWLNGLTDDLHTKLARQGLDKARIEPVVVEPKKLITVREYCDSFSAAIKSDVKLSSQIFYQHVVKRLKEFFGDQPLEVVTPMEAKRFRTWLEVGSNKRDKPDDDGNIKPLAQNTVRRRIGACKKIFGDAIDDGLLSRNPFADLPSTVRSNKDRKKYVPMSDFQLVLNQAPDPKWKLLMLLARVAAFRVPSEVATLRWSDIDVSKKRILVRSPKTEHHQHHESRLLPLFESIETALTEHRDDLVQSGSYKEAGRVFEDIDADSNLRTRFECIIRKAKVQQWPKLWQNLRASAATDMAQIFPSFVATGFCGHTLEVAKEHYYMLTDTDLTAALNSGFGKIAKPEKRST